MTEIKVTMTPSEKEIQRRLDKLGGGIRRLERPHEEISAWLDRWVKLNFRKEGRQGGKKWANLKLVKVDGRLAHGRWMGKGNSRRFKPIPPDKILQKSGQLRASINPFFDRRTAGVGSKLPYAPTHEHGLRSKNIKKRKMLMSRNNRDVWRNVIRIYEKWIIKEQRKARL